MDEIFFDYTLDTYKPPALNAISLCEEAISLIKDIEDDLVDRANLEHVLCELEWSLTADAIIKVMLNAPISKFIRKDEAQRLSDTKVRLEVLHKTINPYDYIDLCEKTLLVEINGGSKKEISKIARTYATTLINMGVSKQHVYEQTQRFFFNGEEIESIQKVEHYFSLISPTSHDYEIYFIVSKLINQVRESIDTFGLQIIDSPPDEILDVAKNNNFKSEDNEVWVQINNIRAYDRHAARKVAEARLDVVRDLFLLFSHKNRIYWRPESIITQCCDEIPVLIRKPKNSMEKCFDLRAKDASIRLNYMIKNIGLEGSSFAKFNRVVDLHASGTVNDLPENQLLNIWISLETLVPSQVHGGGKIVKVTNGIMPILLKKYIPRLVERLSADLVRWNRPFISKLLVRTNILKDKGLYQRVLELIAIPGNSEFVKELYSELGDFHLLRFRVFEIVELFKKPENIIKRLELHEKKVSWQLRRIYRTRNLIVHSGRSIPYIETLIENAHDYLDQALDATLEYTCGILDASSLEQTFDMAKIDYEVYIKDIQEIKKFDENNIAHIL